MKTIVHLAARIILFLLSFNTILYSQPWLYLGQELPGMQPERFPPANLLATSEWQWHGAPMFSPDGAEMYFAKYYTADGKIALEYMSYENNAWIGPEVPLFANPEYDENCPVFSLNGDTLYFVSTYQGGTYFM